jgi:hypothetical protein
MYSMRHRLSAQQCRERVDVQQVNMNCLNEEIKALRADLLEMARAHAAERDRAEGEHAAALKALQDAHAAELQAVHQLYAEKASHHM